MSFWDDIDQAVQELQRPKVQPQLSQDDPEQDFYRQPVDDYFNDPINNYDEERRSELNRRASLPEDEAPRRRPSRFRRFVSDPLVTLEKGLISIPESAVGLIDIASNLGVGNPLSGLPAGVPTPYKHFQLGKTLENAGVDFRGAQEYFDDLYSPEQKEANRKVSEAKGVGETVKQIYKNPSTVPHFVIQSAPAMIGGAGVARGALKLAPKLAPYVAGALGEGTVTAGMSAEQIRQMSENGELSQEQAAIALGSGVLTSLLGAGSAKYAKYLGLADAETLLAGGLKTVTNEKKNVLLNVARAMVTEGALEEWPQSMQEQVAQNLATGKPWNEGVAEAGVIGAITGAVQGGGAQVVDGGVSGFKRRSRLSDLRAERASPERASRLNARRQDIQARKPKTISKSDVEQGIDDRLAALDEVVNGKIIGFENGQPVREASIAPIQAQEEYDFLTANRGNHEAVANKYGFTVSPDEEVAASVKTEEPTSAAPSVKVGDRLPSVVRDEEGFADVNQPQVQSVLDGLPVGSQIVHRFTGNVHEKDSSGEWYHRPEIKLAGNSSDDAGAVGGAGLANGTILRIGKPTVETPIAPAIVTPSGEIIQGEQGETHDDIIKRQPMEWQIENRPVLDSTKDFGFVTDKGNFATRRQAADALGEKLDLTSQRLREIQSSRPPVSNEQVLSAIQGGSVLGKGGNATVYDIPNSEFVLRVSNGSDRKVNGDFKILPDRFNGQNFGQPVAEHNGMQILRRQRGTPAGLDYVNMVKGKSKEAQEANDAVYANSITLAADMPQSAYDQFADDLATLSKVGGKGAQFDPSKSGNVLIDPEGGRFNIVDVNESPSKYKSGLSDMLVVLMGNTYGWKNKGIDLTPSYRAIYAKARAAAEKAGISLELSSSGKASMNMAKLDIDGKPISDTPANTAPPIAEPVVNNAPKVAVQPSQAAGKDEVVVSPKTQATETPPLVSPEENQRPALNFTAKELAEFNRLSDELENLMTASGLTDPEALANFVETNREARSLDNKIMALVDKVSERDQKKSKPVSGELSDEANPPPITPDGPSGFSPSDTLLTKPQLRNNRSYAWRTMGEKEFSKLAMGEIEYKGGDAKRRGFFATAPESAAQFGSAGKYLVEFGGVYATGDEGLVGNATKDNITAVWVHDGEKFNPVAINKTSTPPATISQPSIVELVDWGRQLTEGTSRRGTAKTAEKGKKKSDVDKEIAKLGEIENESDEIVKSPDFFEIEDPEEDGLVEKLVSDSDVSGGNASDTHRVTFFENQEDGRIVGLPTYRSTSRGTVVQVAALPGKKLGSAYSKFIKSGEWVPVASIRVGTRLSATTDPNAKWVYEDYKDFKAQVVDPAKSQMRAAAASYEASRAAMVAQTQTENGAVEKASAEQIDDAKRRNFAAEFIDTEDPIAASEAGYLPEFEDDSAEGLIIEKLPRLKGTHLPDYSYILNPRAFTKAYEAAVSENRDAFAGEFKAALAEMLEKDEQFRDLDQKEQLFAMHKLVQRKLYENIIRSAGSGNVKGDGGKSSRAAIDEGGIDVVSEVTPADESTAKGENIKAPTLIERLEALKNTEPSGIQMTIIPGLDAASFKAIRNTAIDIAIGAIKAGRAVSVAIDEAIAHIRSIVAEFDENAMRSELLKAVGDKGENARLTARKSVAQLEVVEKTKEELDKTIENIEELYTPFQVRVAQKVILDPALKGVFSDVDEVKKMVEAQESAATDLFAYKSDARYGIDPEYTASVTNVADGVIKSISKLRERAGRLDAEFDDRIDKLEKQLAEAMLSKQEKRDLAAVMRVVMEEYKGLLKYGLTVYESAGGVKVLKKALQINIASGKVFEFLVRDGIDPDNILSDTRRGMTFIESLTKRIGATSPQELTEKVGASIEAIRLAGEFLNETAALRKTIQVAQKVLDGKPTKAEEEFYDRLREYVDAGETRKAVDLFSSKLLEAGKERAGYLYEGNFFAAKERRLLVKMEAMKQVREIARKIVSDPDFRKLENEAFSEIGVEQRILTANDNQQLSLRAIPGYTDARILSSGSTQMSHVALVNTIQGYNAMARDYLLHPEALGYSEPLANGLRAWLKYSDSWMSSDMSPQFSDLISGLASNAATGTPVLNFVTQFLEIPEAVAARVYGAPGKYFTDTLGALSTAIGLEAGTMKRRLPDLQIKAVAAKKSHKGIKNFEEYRTLVFNPLLESGQYYGNSGRLSVGSKNVYGEVITQADMDFVKAMRDFQNELIDKTFGKSKVNLSYLSQYRSGIELVDGVLRNRVATGPLTTSRSERMVGDFFALWNESGADKPALLNDNARTILFGYLKGASENSFNKAYEYRTEFNQILKDHMEGEVPLDFNGDLFTQIAERVVELWQNPNRTSSDENPPTVSKVKGAMIGEIGEILKRYDSSEVDPLDSRKLRVAVLGGKSAANTARGDQVFPGLWYDYGSLTSGEHFNAAHSVLTQLEIQHLDAIDGLLKALNQKINDFEKGKESKDDFYTIGMARRAENMLKRYKNNLTKIMVDTKARERRRGGGLTGLGHALQDGYFSSVLGRPSPLLNNLLGILKNDFINRQLYLGEGAAKSALITGGAAIKNAAQFLGEDVSRATLKWIEKHGDYINKMLPIVSRYMADLDERIQFAQEVGIDSNVEFARMMKALLDTAGTGGEVNYDKRGRTGKFAGGVVSTAKFVAGSVGRFGVQKIDQIGNRNSIQMASAIALDLGARWRRFGESRIARAKELGYDPFNVSDPRNRFSDNEISGNTFFGNLAKMRLIGNFDSGLRASWTRNLFQKKLGLSLDAVGIDYLKRIEEAKAKGEDTSKIQFLPDDLYNQLVVAVSEDTNMASFRNRPSAFKTGKGAKFLGNFLGYTAWDLSRYLQVGGVPILGGGSRRRNVGAIASAAERFPLAFTLNMANLAAGSLFIFGASALLGLIRKETPLISLLDAIRSDAQLKNAANSLLQSWSIITPFYGWAVALAKGWGYRNGFDVNGSFILLNAITDIQKLLVEIYQKKSATLPLINYLARVSPSYFSRPFLSMTSGLEERTAVSTLMQKGGRLSDIEVKKFRSGDITYTPTSPMLDRFINAVGNGNMEEADAAVQEMVAYDVAQGKSEAEAIRSTGQRIQGRNPVNQVFGAKLSDDQFEKVLGNLAPEDRTRVQKFLDNYNQAVSAVTGKEVSFTKQPQGSRTSRSTSSRLAPFTARRSRLTRRANYIPSRLSPRRTTRGRRSSRLTSTRRRPRTRTTRLRTAPRRRLRRSRLYSV